MRTGPGRRAVETRTQVHLADRRVVEPLVPGEVGADVVRAHRTRKASLRVDSSPIRLDIPCRRGRGRLERAAARRRRGPPVPVGVEVAGAAGPGTGTGRGWAAGPGRRRSGAYRARPVVGGQDVDAGVDDEGRRRVSASRMRCTVGPDSLPRRRRPGRGTGGRAGQVVQVVPFIVGRAAGPRRCPPARFGGTGHVAALEAGVVLALIPAQGRDLLPAQARHPPLPAVVRRPACSGVIRARRVVRNSLMSARTCCLSTMSSTVRRGPTTPERPCQDPPGAPPLTGSPAPGRDRVASSLSPTPGAHPKPRRTSHVHVSADHPAPRTSCPPRTKEPPLPHV